MPLERQVITMPLAQGVDTKTDDKQVVAGKLLELENGVFTRLKSIQKRNGYKALGRAVSNASAVVPPLPPAGPARLLILGDEDYSDTSEVHATITGGAGASVPEAPAGLPGVSSAVLLDGSEDGYLSTPADPVNYPVGTGNFTFECYVYMESELLADICLFDTTDAAGDDGFYLLIRPDGLPLLADYSTVVDCTSNPLTLDAWNYLVVQRIVNPIAGSSEIVIAVKPNASPQASVSGGASVSPTVDYLNDTITIGNRTTPNVFSPVIISNFRFTRAALYPTFPFTPPAPPLSAGA